MNESLGKNIRQERKRQKISLKGLASYVQVSSSFLSQIENGKNEPSLTTLKKISTCLGVTISKLLGENESPLKTLVKKNTRYKFVNLGDGLEIEFLAAFNPDNIMEICIHNLEPGGKSGVVPYSHPGQEAFFVLEGSLTLQVDDMVLQMEGGDCYYLNNCMRMHCFYNTSDTEVAKMLCITNPPYFYACNKEVSNE